MKILYIATSKIPSRDANSVHIMKMCQAFAEKNLNIELVIPKYGNRQLEGSDIFSLYGINKKFKITRINPLFIKKMSIYSFFAVIYSIFKKVDLIYTRGLRIAFLASIFRKKFILELHNVITKKGDRIILKNIFKSRFLVKLVTITKILKDYFIDLGFSGGKIEVLPDAVDIRVFANKKKEVKKKTKIGYGGHLYDGRGIEIIESLSNLMPEIDFYIWGGIEELLKYWRKRTRGIKNIHFNGFIRISDLAQELMNCNILLMPYQKKVTLRGNISDTAKYMSPLKMFEYMATGAPIISSNLPVLREVLKNNYNAILVESSDIDQWRKAVIFLIENLDVAKRIGENARHDVITKYTWDKRVERILKYINEYKN